MFTSGNPDFFFEKQLFITILHFNCKMCNYLIVKIYFNLKIEINFTE